MSECIIVVDHDNADGNTIGEIVAAIGGLGSVVQVNENEFVIEAAVPAHQVPTIRAMIGVSYVRCVFSYFRGRAPRKSA